MGILAEKRDGKPTGKFRVELQRTVDGQKERYRQRHDTFADAQSDEARVLAMWAQGVAQDAVKTYQSIGGPLTFVEALGIVRADGRVWKNSDDEAKIWNRLGVVAGVIGKEPIETLDAREVNRVITALEKDGKSHATINRYLSHLRRFLTECRTLKLRKAPIEREMFAWQPKKKGRVRWISFEEEAAIYAYLESRDRPEANAVRDLIEVAINTGCRRSELLSAKRHQITGNRLTLWGKDTKTNEHRTVPMSPRTTQLLVNLIESGSMPTERGLRSWWQRVREHMGLDDDRDFVFHACRHTCATRLLDANVNLYVIKEWMGHKVIDTTLIYAHMKPENLDQALVKVGNLLNGGPKEAIVSSDLGVPQHASYGGEYRAVSGL